MPVVVLEIGPFEESETTKTGIISYCQPEVFILWTSFLNIAWNPRCGLVQGGKAYVTCTIPRMYFLLSLGPFTPFRRNYCVFKSWFTSCGRRVLCSQDQDQGQEVTIQLHLV
jgi:hypothetical protein